MNRQTKFKTTNGKPCKAKRTVGSFKPLLPRNVTGRIGELSKLYVLSTLIGLYFILGCKESKHEKYLYPIWDEISGKYGYEDSKGRIAIPYKYDEADHFYEEMLARVKLDNKWGFIDKTDKEVIPLKYDKIVGFSDLFKIKETYSKEVFQVWLDNKYGFLDKTGKEITSVKYESGDWFEDDLARVSIDGKWGYIDITGNEVISIKYEMIDLYCEDLAWAKLEEKQGKWGCIDKMGKEIIPFKYEAGGLFSEGLSAVLSSGKWGYIDKTGEVIITPKFEYCTAFNNGLAEVKLNDKDYYIDMTGDNLYTSAQMYIIWDNYLKDHIRQIWDYRLKLTKTSVSNSSFILNRPFLIINAKSDSSKDIYYENFSENLSDEQQFSDLNTLIILCNYLDFSQLYQWVGTKQNVTIKSYGTYIIYFDMNNKNIIGYDVMRGPQLPNETTYSDDRGNGDISIMISSHLDGGRDAMPLKIITHQWQIR